MEIKNRSSRIRQTLDMVVEKFRTGDIPEVIAIATFPIQNIPAKKWSLLNRIIMCLSGTTDARGIRQWRQAGRRVKKGTKAIRILAPILKKIPSEDVDSEGEDTVITGFSLIPVFRVEDTVGKQLSYQSIKLPELPLLDVAVKWGISTKAVPGNGRFYGCYRPSHDEILLASPEESVLFHELAHAAHHKLLRKGLRNGQDWLQEVVAEFSATVLSYICGKKPINLGHHYEYIDDYARKVHKSAFKVCFEVIDEVERVVNLILAATEEQRQMR